MKREETMKSLFQLLTLSVVRIPVIVIGHSSRR